MQKIRLILKVHAFCEGKGFVLVLGLFGYAEIQNPMFARCKMVPSPSCL